MGGKARRFNRHGYAVYCDGTLVISDGGHGEVLLQAWRRDLWLTADECDDIAETLRQAAANLRKNSSAGGERLVGEAD